MKETYLITGNLSSSACHIPSPYGVTAKSGRGGARERLKRKAKEMKATVAQAKVIMAKRLKLMRERLEIVATKEIKGQRDTKLKKKKGYSNQQYSGF